jgi:biotin operon repressor
MPVLSLLSGAYAVHSRIAELRSMGFTIDHRNEKHGRVIKSFYRLVGSSC